MKRHTRLRTEGFKIRLLLVAAASLLLVGAACSSSTDDSDSSGQQSPSTRQDDTARQDDDAPGTADADTNDTLTTDAYVREVATLLDDIAAAATLVADVMIRADIGDADWRDEAADALGAFESLHERAQQLEANRDAADVQDRLLIATEAYDSAAGLLRDALDSLDPDTLDQANIALGNAIFAVAEVGVLLKDLAGS